jgi:formylglycine-generating enzyme required for sulfatase activity
MKTEERIRKNFLILESLLSKLLSVPNSFESEYITSPDFIDIYFFVDEKDFEPLIGKNGRIIHALRTLASSISLKFNKVPSTVYIESKNIMKPEYITIEKQTCIIGSDMGNDEKPIHKAFIDCIHVLDAPVTYYQWKKIYNWAIIHGYQLNNSGNIGGDYDENVIHIISEPVTKINWYDTVKWCNALSEYEEKEPVYFTDGRKKTIYRTGNIPLSSNCVAWEKSGYRLLTEAEWEGSARAGSTGHFFWGNDKHLMNDYTWNCFNSGFKTHPVKTKLPNGLNLYDLMGNVYEWCWDWHGAYVPHSDGIYGPGTGSVRIVRGGSFDSDEYNFRCAKRPSNSPESATHDIGFRVCRRGI